VIGKTEGLDISILGTSSLPEFYWVMFAEAMPWRPALSSPSTTPFSLSGGTDWTWRGVPYSGHRVSRRTAMSLLRPDDRRQGSTRAWVVSAPVDALPTVYAGLLCPEEHGAEAQGSL